MIDLTSLIKSTKAYDSVKTDLKEGRLSHAYLLLCADKENLDNYLKEFAKAIFCLEGKGCGKCRYCSLIEQGLFTDVVMLPKEGQNISADDITALVQDTFVKPYEADKKLYLISHGETMNASAQNKLLKTLEEPPKNVHIIIGAVNEHSLLPTIKSRVKKLEIPVFSNAQLIMALKDECSDAQKLHNAVCVSDGTVGSALKYYHDENIVDCIEFCIDVLVNMQSSSQVIDYADKLSKLKCDFIDVLTVLELLSRDMLILTCGNKELVFSQSSLERLRTAKGFTQGSLIAILEDIVGAKKRLEANSSKNMVAEWLLFKILEEKYKWQKL